MTDKKPEEVRDFMLGLEDRVVFADGKAKLVSPQEAEEQAEIVVTTRVSQARFKTAGSIEEPCSECGEMCFRSPSSPKAVRLVCMPCAIPMMEKEAAIRKFSNWEPTNKTKN